MADLESFFAKKDKKKKSKKVEIVPDELLKKIELAQKEESVEVDSQGLVDTGYDSNGDQPPKVLTVLPNTYKDDEEWNEFEREKEIDFSSLKIQNLGEMEKERHEVEEQEELQKAVEESKCTMKWNITRKEESSDDEEVEPKEPQTDTGSPEQNNDAVVNNNNNNNNNNKEEPKSAAAETPSAGASKRYVPPAMRAQALNQSQDVRSSPASSGPILEKTSIKRHTMRNQKIDVNSTDQFPSLGMALQNTSGKGFGLAQDGSFTSVRKGARNIQKTTPDQKGLSTSNKFSVLKSNRT